MEITTRTAKTILTPQKSGLLASGPYPFTHSLSPYTGCGFGATTCGLYCYAQFLPNWTHSHPGIAWGSAVQVKENAAEVLAQTLAAMSTPQRRSLRIFMASTTDPYQPIEATHQVTRGCLEVFTQYDDLDLLVIQTRAPLAARDFDLMRHIPYVWLSVSIETDDAEVLRALTGGPSPAKRFALIEEAKQQGIKTQIAVSPCLPYTDHFADRLLALAPDRIIVDNFTEGDGGRGYRTARSPYAAANLAWREQEGLARQLSERLALARADVYWSTSGFCSIPPRSGQATQSAMPL
ncbi:MAG TPA: hypothetical protein VF707_18780 [Ardenticatenaceae bacterium]|jgi:DNA repair photolyase